MFRRLSITLTTLSVILGNYSHAKDYRDVKVGKFDQVFDLTQCGEKTFLTFMRTKVYDAIKNEASQSNSRDHFDAIKKGDGVEIRLTPNVTTYHVKYKSADEDKAERSGRSYAAVGLNRNGVVDYLADASDKFYLDSLETMGTNKRELENFYRAILGVITTCDASAFEKLKVESQRVAADFVAVYVAEQYRHLIGGDGDLGRTFNWDDALLQVTMLASFHSGQSSDNGGLFYEGRFTDEVYNQVNVDQNEDKHCFYRQFEDPFRKQFDRRESRLNDYWQMNRECKRSGINMTRSDFTKLATAITAYANENTWEELEALSTAFGAENTDNAYKLVSKFYIDNDAPQSLKRRSKKMIDATVDFLLSVRENADEITTLLKQ